MVSHTVLLKVLILTAYISSCIHYLGQWKQALSEKNLKKIKILFICLQRQCLNLLVHFLEGFLGKVLLYKRRIPDYYQWQTPTNKQVSGVQ